MNILLIVIVALHGLIHLLGFLKGFQLKEIAALRRPISKPVGLVWLFATILLLSFAVLTALDFPLRWPVGILAVLVSQTLILLNWKEARWGSLPNLILLLVSVVLFGSYRFQQFAAKERDRLLAPEYDNNYYILFEEHLANLPSPVQNWIRQSGALGMSRTRMAKVVQKASMQMRPGQRGWMTATAVQYTTMEHPSFIWEVEANMNPLIFFRGMDKFEEGRGSMLIKFNSLINVVNEQGIKLNEAAMQRYLGEMVWFPSLALSRFITWESVNDTTATATMRYKGTTAAGTFYFNSRGDVTRYSAYRYRGNDEKAQRELWEMNITGYKTFGEIKVPAFMTSTWKTKEGDWTWLKLEVVSLTCDQDSIP